MHDDRVAGCDLGKSTLKLAVGALGDAGDVSPILTRIVEHGGQPLDAFRALYREEALSSCVAIAATGVHAEELSAPVARLPERACLEAALAARPELRGPLNVVSIGARGYSVLTRDDTGRFRYLENDKCSSGTGETMVKIAGRFGVDIAEADRMACEASETIAITARCSVFAKSEMTHFGNQGRPADALFRGYFRAVATYACALLERGRVDGPIYLVGGGARLVALVDAFREITGVDVRALEPPQLLEAVGAMRLAAEGARRGARPLPADAGVLVSARAHRFRALHPARGAAGRVTRLAAPPIPDGADREPCVLGLDLGSTGSKAVLTSLASGQAVLSVYDRTRGNPVGAAERLLEAVLSRTAPDVRAIGLTGSGREAVATVLRAAYPERQASVVVINEIVAHATAAIECDVDAGRSLSVVEIGGQDAKFIQIVGGQIVESDMNKACSAGTGSFLEEQARFYGVERIEEFTRRAQLAERPPDLGQMCTVFVAEAATDAHHEGYSVEDLFGGFQYSVIHNYINRVMGQRTFADRIFFQGKPATGVSLAWTLAAVTDRDVVVPADPGAMGAWGVGLSALRSIGADVLAAEPSFDLRAALGATVVRRTEFQCRDRRCATLCSIEKTTVRIAGSRQTVLSGGACPKYEVSTAARPRLPKDAPSAFDEREALLERYAYDVRADVDVGLPVVGTHHGVLPWLATLLRELGLGVRLLRPAADSLARGEARCHSFDACAPIKVAHGVVDADVDTVFLPKLIDLHPVDGLAGTTCAMEQGLPEMVREALRARGRALRVVHPVLPLARGLSSLGLLRRLTPVVGELGADPDRLPAALLRAAEAQERYERELRVIGERSLAWAREHGVPAVVVCGNLHVVHDPCVNADIPRLLRENGVVAIPGDALPVPPTVHPIPRVDWAEARRALRVALAARARGDAYPLLLTSFGCGPSSFVEQIFAALMQGHPHTTLESDGHGGSAGYVTRVQAFLHAVREHDGAPSRPPRAALRALEPVAAPALRGDGGDAPRVLVLSFADRLTDAITACFGALGVEAVSTGPGSAEALALGRRDCSGKECLPYQLIWGAFRQRLEAEPSERRELLLQVTGEGRCRNCMFSVKDQLTLSRMGLSDRVAPLHMGESIDLGRSFRARIWSGVVAWDVLHQLRAYHGPDERDPREGDDRYHALCDELVAILARPAGSGVADVIAMRRVDRDLRALLSRAARSYYELRRRSRAPADARTVLLSGDIYVRIDEHASDRLVRRLHALGLRVLVEPVWLLAAYMADERLPELFGLPTAWLDNAVEKRAMAAVRRGLYAAVRPLHPWLPEDDAADVREASRALIDRYPQGEAPVTVGSVLLHHAERRCDGVVVASPWGCGPALVSESLLRHRSDIPSLFVYSDGSPIDQRRLDGFAWELKRAPARVAAS